MYNLGNQRFQCLSLEYVSTLKIRKNFVIHYSLTQFKQDCVQWKIYLLYIKKRLIGMLLAGKIRRLSIQLRGVWWELRDVRLSIQSCHALWLTRKLIFYLFFSSSFSFFSNQIQFKQFTNHVSDLTVSYYII